MKITFIKILLLTIVVFVFTACGEEETNTGGGYVSFRLELQGRDSKLAGVYNYAMYTSPRLSGEYLGKSGLLVFNQGLGEDNVPILIAYDLCCPYENRNDIKIKVNSDGLSASCSTCESKFDLPNGGIKVSGPAKRRLFTYNVIPRDSYSGIFDVRS